MNYDKTKYKVWTWKNPMMLHWIINPGLVVNELALGQRIPKIMLIERNSPKSINEKSWIPCPHCGVLHEGLKWSKQNETAFKNWFGYYCDNCGKTIPCLTNLTSFIVLGVTFPIWFWFKNKLKAKWLEKQKSKFSKPLNLIYTEPTKTQWLLVGLLFGLFMYVFMEVLLPFTQGENITQKRLLIGIPIWLIGGLLFGLMTKCINRRKKENLTHNRQKMSKNRLNMRNVFAIAICLASMITFSGCEKDPFPLGTENWNSIACIARITENSADWSVCIMDKEGKNMRKIVDKSFGFPIPKRSNSGEQLLFSMNGLHFVGIDGTGLTLIEGANGNAGWAPDDKQIAYIKYSGDNRETSELFLYNIADKTHTLLQADGNDKAGVNFSPNGKQIAYSAYSENSTDIYTIDIDGKNNQLLIQNGYCPIWSPKGDKIAYLSFGQDRSNQIFVANANGSGQKQLTSTVSPEWWDTGFPRDGNSDPQWTPDGKKIVYVSWENGKPEIFIMNADGSGQTRLTKAEHRDEYPEVTPDGNYILFASTRSNMMNGGICVMKLDGSNQKVISKTGICPVVCK